MSIPSLTTATNRLSAVEIAEFAVAALCDEADLTPKPGLVDGRGSGAHDDMTQAMLHASARALGPAFAECAAAAEQLPLGLELRRRIGAIGRAAEQQMMQITGGVNTHRGALWAVGLLCTAAGLGHRGSGDICAAAGQLARLPDHGVGDRPTVLSHGARVRSRYRVDGAPGEARSGFPHLTRYALPALRSHPGDTTAARLDTLLTLMAHLDDTCVLHRGGPSALAALQDGARAVLAAGGVTSVAGRRRLARLDSLCAHHRLSPGGSGDLLAATLFVESVEGGRAPACRH